MLAGTSDLHNIGYNNIMSPTIQIKLKENSFLNLNDLSITGITLENRADSIIFNDLLITSTYDGIGISSNGNAGQGLFVYKITDNTLGTGNTVSLSPAPSTLYPYHWKFLNTGNTLMMFIHSIATGLGQSSVLYTLSSTGGTVWGNTDIIFQGGESNIVDITPVSATRMYFLLNVQTIPNNQGNIVNLFNFDKGSGSWGISKINISNIVVCSNQPQAFYMDGANVNNEDILIMQASTYLGMSLGTQPDLGGVRIMRTDGTNIFGEIDLFDTFTNNSYTSISNLTKGPTLYYLAVDHSQYNFYIQGGITQASVNFTNTIVYSSIDLLNWNSGVFVPTNFGISRIFQPNNAPSTRGFRTRSIAAGITSIEYILYGPSNMGFVSSKLQNNLDLSGDLTNYTNENNSRINLSVGNLR